MSRREHNLVFLRCFQNAAVYVRSMCLGNSAVDDDANVAKSRHEQFNFVIHKRERLVDGNHLKLKKKIPLTQIFIFHCFDSLWKTYGLEGNRYFMLFVSHKSHLAFMKFVKTKECRGRWERQSKIWRILEMEFLGE